MGDIDDKSKLRVEVIEDDGRKIARIFKGEKIVGQFDEDDVEDVELYASNITAAIAATEFGALIKTEE